MKLGVRQEAVAGMVGTESPLTQLGTAAPGRKVLPELCISQKELQSLHTHKKFLNSQKQTCNKL